MITKNLERVRRVKTRHQRLSTRVETVRDELQRFLEDDDDMIKMCLTRKQALLRGQVSHTGGAPPSLSSPLSACDQSVPHAQAHPAARPGLPHRWGLIQPVKPLDCM